MVLAGSPRTEFPLPQPPLPPRAAHPAASQRDAAGRQASAWLTKLREALDVAEVKDGEVDEMKLQRGTVGGMPSLLIFMLGC